MLAFFETWQRFRSFPPTGGEDRRFSGGRQTNFDERLHEDLYCLFPAVNYTPMPMRPLA
jgi:hypothetical protein